MVSKTAVKHPQEIYTMVAREIQSELIVLQFVTKDMGKSLNVFGKVLRKTFLPCIFFGGSKNLPPFVGALSMLPINNTGMVL